MNNNKWILILNNNIDDFTLLNNILSEIYYDYYRENMSLNDYLPEDM